jgi:hypothetical protein
MRLIKDNVKVTWEDIGEGLCGDYNPLDPDDIPLYRFYVEERLEDGEWADVEDASYCTQVPVDTPDDILEKLLVILMDHFYCDVVEGNSVKKIGERMSWIEPSWAKEEKEPATHWLMLEPEAGEVADGIVKSIESIKKEE